MKKCTFGFVALCSALCLSGMVPVLASACPVYHKSLARVRYMPQEPLVKVLLAKEQAKLTVEVKGPHTIYDPFTGKKLDSSFLGSSYTMIPTLDGVKWGQEFPGVYQILIIAEEPLKGVTVNGVSYGGVVAFYQVKDQLAAVNWVTLDDFTTSLMSSNFLPRESDQKEALAAYAIAVRSKVCQQMHSSENTFYDLIAECCGYKGISVARTDDAFVEAMKATKQVTLSGQSVQAVPGLSFDQKSIEEVRRKIPLGDANDLAKDGKDARYILHKFYPDEMLCIATQRPVSSSEYLK
jgi:stage II sporulation protein D